MSNIYLLDTNAIIDLIWRTYPQKPFGSLHSLIDRLIDEQRLLSSWEVLEEVRKQDDDTQAWCEQRKRIFLKSDRDTQQHLRQVLARTPNILDPARPEKNAADPWLIALALKYNAAIVTDEKSNPKSKVAKLPDACRIQNVTCLRLLELMQREQWEF